MKTRPLFEDVGITVDGADGTALMSLDRDSVIDLFKQHGVVLFDGFAVDAAAFEAFTNQFSSDYMGHEGGGSVREVINKEGDRTVLSVAYSHNAQNQRTFPLALHSDRSYTKSQPPLMWFCCKVPSAKEGETTVADGRRIYAQLSPATHDYFREHPISYVRHYKDGEWQLLWYTDDLEQVKQYAAENDLTLEIGEDRSVQTRYVTSAFKKTKWGEEDAFINSMLLVEWQERVLGRTTSLVRDEKGEPLPEWVWDDIKSVADRNTHEVRWEPGQMLMIDNTRMLHGRRSFQDANREIYVRMARSVDW